MFRFQDYAATATVEAAKEAFTYAKKIPADKLNWVPAGQARCALDLCRELAMTPTWGVESIEDKPMDFSEEAMAKMKEEQSKWTTVEQCEAECNKRLEKLVEVYKAIPDETLQAKRSLPFGNKEFTVAEMMEYARWNFAYHQGQLAYIQTLYGDMETYF
jgi:hypothetical protein